MTLPENVETFIADLQQQMAEGLEKLDQGMPSNSGVKIIGKGKGLIRVSPIEPVSEPRGKFCSNLPAPRENLRALAALATSGGDWFCKTRY